MKKKDLFLAMIALVLFAGFFSGCDNRSQLEKDADAAAAKINKALK